ncbi:MAG: hypothetical protein QOC94_614 [Actinoplanes sp.]|nr:hypothetical protein [Actinoplanes sp.]
MTRYMLMQNYEGGVCDEPMGTWDPADVKAHIDFQIALNDELTAAGELVDGQGVAEEITVVVSDGVSRKLDAGPLDRPRLAGYRIVDVESHQRALDIAARSSAAPGPAGVPLQQPIEVRRIMD